jgi:membrane protein YdbS with pleckstrin-like domain
MNREDKWVLLFLALMVLILNIGGSIYLKTAGLVFSGPFGALLVLAIVWYLFLKPKRRRGA